MRAPLTDVAVLVDPKAVLLDRVERLDGLVRRAFPVRYARRERVGQIDEWVRLHDGQGVGECPGSTCIRRARDA